MAMIRRFAREQGHTTGQAIMGFSRLKRAFRSGKPDLTMMRGMAGMSRIARQLAPSQFKHHPMKPRGPHTLHHARMHAMGDAMYMGDPFRLRLPKIKLPKAIRKFQPGKHLGLLAGLATLPFGGAGLALGALGSAARLGGGLLRGAGTLAAAGVRRALGQGGAAANTFVSEMGADLGSRFQQAFEQAPTEAARQKLVSFARQYGFDVSDAAANDEAQFASDESDTETQDDSAPVDDQLANLDDTEGQ